MKAQLTDASDLRLQPAARSAWRRLHLVGGYYLWLQFMVSFGKRIPDMPLYGLFLIPLLAVLALRLIAMARTARSIAVS
jgi:sulfoxide reductase heme-binding subunit YedZ